MPFSAQFAERPTLRAWAGHRNPIAKYSNPVILAALLRQARGG